MSEQGRYPRWLRDALYSAGIEVNILEPQGVYSRPSIRPAPFYTQYGVQFVWDVPYSGYAVAVAGGRPDLAKGFVENMVEFAIPGGPDAGSIPRSVTLDGHQAGQDGSQAPLLAWLTWELHQMEADEAFLSRVYPALAGFIDWWQSPRRDYDGDGLSEYGGSTATYVSYESGHDYSPERDLVMGEPTGPSADGLVHEPIADVFLNASLYGELAALAQIAAVVDAGRAPQWAERRDMLEARMNETMWDEEVGAFFPVIRRDLCPVQPRVYHHTPAILQPLWAGLATQEQADRTVALLRNLPREYPLYDGQMSVRLGAGRYHGYQVVTDALHPTRGTGAAAGGVELADDGFVVRFDEDRGPSSIPFNRLELLVDVAESSAGGAVEVEVVDGRGESIQAIKAAVQKPGTIAALVGADPMEQQPRRTWTPGLREIRLRATGCSVRELTVRYSRMDRSGLLSAYGLKSAHPLDGKHPGPGVPTDFWSGTIWGPHQLHGCLGLTRYGYADLAKAIAMNFCDATARSFGASGEAFEHLSHEDGRGLGTTGYTWGVGTALVLMQELLEE